MQDKSNIQKPWYELGTIVRSGSGWIIKDLLVRWNESQTTKQTDLGEEIEYTYDAYRFNYILPVTITSVEEAEYYLEQAKDAILARAQALAAQEVGLNGTD